MIPIRGKQNLNRHIKEALWSNPEDNIVFPVTLFFCEGLGSSTFKITIEKIEENSFVDGNGKKWVCVE